MQDRRYRKDRGRQSNRNVRNECDRRVGVEIHAVDEMVVDGVAQYVCDAPLAQARRRRQDGGLVTSELVAKETVRPLRDSISLRLSK